MLPPCFTTQPSFQCRALGNVPEQSFMICSPRRQGLQSLPAWLCHHHLGWHLPNINIGACPSGCKVSVQSHPLSWLPEQLQTVPAAEKALQVWIYFSFPAQAAPSSGRGAKPSGGAANSSFYSSFQPAFSWACFLQVVPHKKKNHPECLWANFFYLFKALMKKLHPDISGVQ